MSAAPPVVSGWIVRVKEKLGFVHQLDPGCVSFGAKAHRYTFDAPMPSRELEAFERERGVRLPEEYRDYLLHLGRSGAGPDYGVRPLGAWEWRAGGLGGERASRLDRPFPLEAAWEAEWDEEGDAVTNRPCPADVNLHDGVLDITDFGCGDVHLLVVSGPCAGQVWADFSPNGGAIYPEAPSLSAWIEAWLDERLVALGGERAMAAVVGGEGVVAEHAALEEAARCVGVFEGRWPWGTLVHGCRLALYLGEQALAERKLLEIEGSALGPKPGVDPPSWLLELREQVWRADLDAARGVDPEGHARVAGHPAQIVREALASNPAVAPTTCVSLEDVRPLALLDNDALPASMVERLFARLREGWLAGGDRVEALIALEAIARHPATSREIVTALLGWEAGETADPLASWVVRATARGARLEPGRLEGLASHPLPWVRHAVIGNQNTPAGTLRRLAEDPSEGVRAGLAGWRGVSSEAVEALLVGASMWIVEVTASNPNTPPDALVRLMPLARTYGAVVALFANPSLPAEARDVVRLHPSIRDPDNVRVDPASVDVIGGTCREAVGQQKVASPSWPTPLFARIPDGHISLYHGALHPFLDDALIERLATDSYAYTRARIAARHGLPLHLLERLALDPVGMVCGAAAQRVPLSPSLLDRLLVDADSDALMGLAQNPTLPLATLETLGTHRSEIVRRSVGLNPSAPVGLLERLASDEHYQGRWGVAWGTAATEGLLERLASDTNTIVARTARWNLGVRRMTR